MYSIYRSHLLPTAHLIQSKLVVYSSQYTSTPFFYRIGSYGVLATIKNTAMMLLPDLQAETKRLFDIFIVVQYSTVHTLGVLLSQFSQQVADNQRVILLLELEQHLLLPAGDHRRSSLPDTPPSENTLSRAMHGRRTKLLIKSYCA